jgi:hypothetical protein
MTLNVLIQSNPEDGYIATVLGWLDFVVKGKTKAEALANVKTEMVRRLTDAEIVELHYEPANKSDSWMKFAGMWKDDPTFDDFLAEIKAYRQELDKEWEENEVIRS